MSEVTEPTARQSHPDSGSENGLLQQYQSDFRAQHDALKQKHTQLKPQANEQPSEWKMIVFDAEEVAAPQGKVNIPVLEVGQQFKKNAAPTAYDENSPEARVYKNSRQSTVQLVGHPNNRLRLLGSGFIVSTTGDVVSNLHVVDNLKQFQIMTSDGRIYDAEIKYRYNKSDLALLKIHKSEDDSNQFAPLSLGSSPHKKGSTVFALGHPEGTKRTFLSPGEYTSKRAYWQMGLNQAVVDQDLNQPLLELRLHTEPGNSGGPLLDPAGNVIGVIELGGTSRYTGAIPVESVKKMLRLSKVQNEIAD